MKNPYAISDFENIRLENYHYVDRTHKIPLLEGIGKFGILHIPVNTSDIFLGFELIFSLHFIRSKPDL